MAKKVINIGLSANDGTGDSLRIAGGKINDNFTEVYDALSTAYSYTLPKASASVLGGVKVGANLSMNASTGVLSASVPNDLTDLNIVDGLDGQFLTTDGGGNFSFTSLPSSISGLNDLTDVVLSSPTNNQYLKYDGTKWVNSSVALTTSLSGLTDVDLNGPTAGQVLKFDGTNWINDTDAGGSGNPFDQNLNTTDVVEFATVTAEEVDLSGSGTPTVYSETDLYLSATGKVSIVTKSQFTLGKFTTAEVTALSNKGEGDIWYNTTTDTYQGYANGTVVSLSGSGSADTGLFSFNGNSVTISNDDMDLITTRTSWDTDADIGLDAADDIWIDAQGDQLALSAGNSVIITSRTSPMYDNVFGGNEQDFIGMWDGTTVTIYTIGGSTLDNLMAEYVANSDRNIWLETSAGFVELYTTAVAQNPGPAHYVLTVATSSPSAELNIVSMKVWDNTQVYNSQWTFRRDGVTQIPGPIDFATRTINLHNGGNQTAQVLQFNTANFQAVITGPTPADGESAQRLIIQGQRAIGQGEGGDVYVWGGDADTNGGDIKIYAGDADDGASGYGGYVNLDGGYGYDQGGDVQISGGNSNLSGGSVTLTAGGGTTNGVIYLQTYGNTWTLDSNGALTLPVGGDIKDNSGNSVLVSGARFVEAPASSTGQIGDLQGDIAFNNSYMYYCKQDYVGLTWTTIDTTDQISYGSPMRLRCTVPDITNLDKPLRIYNCSVNNVIVEYAEVTSYALVSGSTYDFFVDGYTGGFQNTTFLKYSPDVLPDIWKRVAWSNDTW